MSTVKLLTGFDRGFRAIGDITVPRMRQLADRFGYDFRYDDTLSAAPHRPNWAKVPYLLRELADGADFVVWIDADALILRFDRDIRDCLDDHHDLWMAWHTHVNCETPHPNTGLMIFRNNEWSRDFLTKVWALRDRIATPWEEQSAVHELIGLRAPSGMIPGVDTFAYREEPSPDRAHLGRLPNEWNTIPHLSQSADPIVHHYCGLSQAQRLAWMSEDNRTIDTRAHSEELRRDIVRLLQNWMQESYQNALNVPSGRRALAMLLQRAPAALRGKLQSAMTALSGTFRHGRL
jgi:hypothetical protein